MISPFPEHDLPVRTFQQLAPTLPQIDAIAEALTTGLRFGGSIAQRWESEAVAADVAGVIPDLQTLSYKSYRALVGALNSLRGDTFQSFQDIVAEVARDARYGSDLKSVMAQLLKVRNEVCSGGDSGGLEVNAISAVVSQAKASGLTDSAFASSSLLLVRATSRLGINIVNPDWLLSDRGAYDRIPTDTVIQIGSGDSPLVNSRVQDGIFTLESSACGSKTNLFFVTKSGEKVPSGSIADGESIIFGRILYSPTIFDQPLQLSKHSRSPLLILSGRNESPDLIHQPNRGWSRAAIMASRIDGDILLFDRGHFRNLHVVIDGRAAAKYTPKIKKQDDGTMAFGETEIF